MPFVLGGLHQPADTWLEEMRNRDSEPLAPSTIATWAYALEKWINVNIGDLPLESANNLAMRELVAKMVKAGLTVAGQSILASNPNLSISLPGGISVIVNQQTRSSGGNAGSITVNALHVTGPSIDIVVGSAQSDIACS